MRKFILISALLLASASAQAGENRSLSLAVLPTAIPDKGKVLNQISSFWFSKTRGVVKNHLIASDVSQYPPELQKYRAQLDAARCLQFYCPARRSGAYPDPSAWLSALPHGMFLDLRRRALRRRDVRPVRVRPVHLPVNRSAGGEAVWAACRDGCALALRAVSVYGDLYRRAAHRSPHPDLHRACVLRS